MGLVITIGGPHGTGKSTYARIVANKFKLRSVSAGEFFREMARERCVSLEELSKQAAQNEQIDRLIDEQSVAQAAEGNVVIEGQLAAWMARDIAQVRIYLKAPEQVRMARIARRDCLDYEDARRQTLERERIQRERYKRYYGIDIDDTSLYNVVLDTGNRSVEDSTAELMRKIRDILATRQVNKRPPSPSRVESS